MTKMLDSLGEELKVGDFVQLTEGKPKYINASLRKGNVYKVHSIRNIDGLIVCYLTGKKGGYYAYDSGFQSRELLKVGYDFKKRKVIKLEDLKND